MSFYVSEGNAGMDNKNDDGASGDKWQTVTPHQDSTKGGTSHVGNFKMGEKK